VGRSQNLIARSSVRIFLDSSSIDSALEEGSRSPKVLLNYSGCSEMHDRCEIKNFRRSPGRIENDKLESMDKFDFHVKSNGQVFAKIEYGPNPRKIPLHKDIRTLKKRAEREFDSNSIEKDIYRVMFLESFQTLAKTEENTILVTCDSKILDKKGKFHGTMGKEVKSIMNPEEALDYVGIHGRIRNFAHHSPGCNTSIPFGWYLNIYKVVVPHNGGEADYSGALMDRFQHLFMALDQSGAEHYKHVDNSTQLEGNYHFNYGISLVWSYSIS